MAHILDFKVEGLAGRNDFYCQTLNRDINVFFGPNGSGKTSLLRILDSAMSGDASALRRVPFRSAEVTIHSRNDNRAYIRSIGRPSREPQLGDGGVIEQQQESFFWAEDLPPWYDDQEELSWATTPLEPDTSNIRWRHIYLPTWRAFQGSPRALSRFRSREVPDTGIHTEREYDWDILFAERLDQLWTRYSNDLLAAVRDIQGEGLVRILQAVISPNAPANEVDQLDSDTAYQRVSAFLARQGAQDILGVPDEFAKRYAGEPQLRDLVSDIDTIEHRIDGAMASRNKLEHLIGNMFARNKSVSFENSGIGVEAANGERIGLAALSSGEKQSLRVFIDALRAEENSLLIDEPELSLHVDWQRNLISSMRELNPNAQLILATHSPEIMAEIPDEKIFQL